MTCFLPWNFHVHTLQVAPLSLPTRSLREQKKRVLGIVARTHTTSRAAHSKMSKWKDNLAPGDLASACTFNSMFLTMAMLDYSADVWASQTHQTAFLVQYVNFKAEMPVFGKVLFGLLLMLPLVIFGMISGVLQFVLGWRQAPIQRHIVDCVEFCTLVFIFYTIVTAIAPATAAFQSACAGPKVQKAACSAAIETLTAKHLLIVLLNIGMFCYPIIKYRYNRPSSLEKVA